MIAPLDTSSCLRRWVIMTTVPPNLLVQADEVIE